MFADLKTEIDAGIKSARVAEMTELLIKSGCVLPGEINPPVNFDVETASYAISPKDMEQAKQISELLLANGFNGMLMEATDTTPLKVIAHRAYIIRVGKPPEPINKKDLDLPPEIAVLGVEGIVRVHRRTNRNGMYITCTFEDGSSTKFLKAPGEATYELFVKPEKPSKVSPEQQVLIHEASVVTTAAMVEEDIINAVIDAGIQDVADAINLTDYEAVGPDDDSLDLG